MQYIQTLSLVFILLAAAVTDPVTANELTNPGFDSDLTGWENPSFLPPENRATPLATDGGPVSGPGCLEEGTTFNNAGQNGLYQSIPVSVGQSYVVSGWSRVPNASPGNGAVLFVSWMNNINSVIGIDGSTFNFDAGGGWHYHSAVVTPPPGTVTARIRPSIQSVDTGSVESVARWDDLAFLPALIFEDGFESGNTLAWTVP